MSFTWQGTYFFNGEAFDEVEHAKALASGIVNFIGDGLEYQNGQLSSGHGINNGVPFIIGKVGEMQTVTENFTGAIVIETILDGVDSNTRILEMQTVPESTNTVKYFRVYDLQNGVMTKDYRHINYVKSFVIERTGADTFKFILNGYPSNDFTVPDVVTTVNNIPADDTGNIQLDADDIGAVNAKSISSTITDDVSGWYRIAKTDIGSNSNLATFKVVTTGAGEHTCIYLNAGINPVYSSSVPALNQLFRSVHSTTIYCITKARLVYRLNEAYLELYRVANGAYDATWYVEMSDNFYSTWSLIEPTLTDSIEGFETLELDFNYGIATTGAIRANGASFNSDVGVNSTLWMGNNNIRDVADGVNLTDAVNKRQLDAVADGGGGYEVHEDIPTTSSWYKIADGIGNSFDGDFRVEFYNIATGEVGAKCEFYASYCYGAADVVVKSSQLSDGSAVASIQLGWYIDDTGLYVNIYSIEDGTEGIRTTIYRQNNIVYNFEIFSTSPTATVNLNNSNSAMFSKIQVDSISSTTSDIEVYGDIDMKTHAITNLKDGVNLGDAVTKRQLDTIRSENIEVSGDWYISTHDAAEMFHVGLNTGFVAHGGDFEIWDSLAVGGIEIRPQSNNYTYLGNSTYQFKKLYLYDTVIGMADTRNAEFITDIPDTVLDAWQEVKYQQFKRTDESEWHFGIFAQHIFEVFNARSLNPIDYGLVQYDEWEERRWIEKDPITKEDVEKVEPAGSSYMVSHDECQYLELALQRRTTERLQTQINELQALTAQLKRK